MTAISAPSALLTAASGALDATRRFDAAAQRTVQDPTGDNAVQNSVDLITSKEGFTADLKVLQVADQMQKQLLDIKV